MSLVISQDIRRSQGVQATPERQTRAGTATSAPIVAPKGQGIVQSPDAMAQLDANQTYRTGYDQPDQKQQKAILAYQQTATLAKREQLHQLFSVDVYA